MSWVPSVWDWTLDDRGQSCSTGNGSVEWDDRKLIRFEFSAESTLIMNGGCAGG